MAKPIYMTSHDVESICAEVRNTLSGRCYGSIDFKRSIKSDDRIAALYFTPTAWIKMMALVSRFDTEVQWHGMVRRISESEFEIYDIIVPPHEVSGATVTSEYKSYIEWMDSLDDDTFNAVRFHGHSHVNMSVSPSSVDNKYRLDLVTQLPKPAGDDDVFYIFLIINKRHEWSAEIYDLTNNALYGTDEIYMECNLDGCDLDTFVAEAKKVAVTRIAPTSPSYPNYGSTRYYSGYSYNGFAPHVVKDVVPTAQKSIGKQKGKKRESADTYFDYDYDSFEDVEDIYDVGVDVDDEIDDPNDPFYVKEY